MEAFSIGVIISLLELTCQSPQISFEAMNYHSWAAASYHQLLPFDFETIYKGRKENNGTDALSRKLTMQISSPWGFHDVEAALLNDPFTPQQEPNANELLSQKSFLLRSFGDSRTTNNARYSHDWRTWHN